MPGNPRPVLDERDGLLTYLAQMRYVLKLTAHGLTDEQARQAPTVSRLSVGGLIKHVADVESFWIKLVLQQWEPQSEGEYSDNFVLTPDETLAGIIARYDDVAQRTEQVIAGIDDLGQLVPVPKDVPWFPKDVEAWSVRWALLHLIQETARHTGQADIIRESLDGATAMPLMSAAEGWPETPWIKPWRPATKEEH